MLYFSGELSKYARRSLLSEARIVILYAGLVINPGVTAKEGMKAAKGVTDA